MKKYYRYTIQGLLVLMVTLLVAGTMALANTSAMELFLGNEEVDLSGEVAAFLEERGSAWKLVVAARGTNAVFNLGGAISGDMKGKEIALDSEWQSISLMIIKDGKAFHASPSVRYVKEKKRRWKNISRSQRLARGLGVVRNRSAQGSSVVLRLVPVRSGNEIVALEGTFSGALVPTDLGRGETSSKALPVRGKFYADVRR